MEPEQYNILFIDDEIEYLSNISNYLVDTNFVPTPATSILQARELLSANSDSFTAIVVDINLSAETANSSNGIEFARWLRDTYPSKPIVGYSSYRNNTIPSEMSLFADIWTKREAAARDSFLKVLKEITSISTEPKDSKLSALATSVKQEIVLINSSLIKHVGYNISKLYTMTPRVFEELVAELFEREGYEVILTPPSKDGGKDLYVYKKDLATEAMYLVECKRYNSRNKVGVELARQLYGVVGRERANGGILVTTSYFTKGAVEFAEALPHYLFLKDIDHIEAWIKKYL